jgi:phosphoglucosamine mutase
MYASILTRKAPSGDQVGGAQRIDDAVGRYIVELKHTIPNEMTLDGIKLVVDCANGAAYRTAPAVFQELGAETLSLGVSPDGKNINHACGSLHPELASRHVIESGAHVGIALDGDADRVILLDEKGQVVDGDAVMALCATRMLREKTLNKRTLVTTVMSNLGLDWAVKAAGGKVVRTQVGDRYVVEQMRKKGYNFGGEQSGHLIFLDHAATGDGILAALQILSIVIREQKPLSELAATVMERIPQSLVSFEVPQKLPLDSLDQVKKAIASVEKSLGAQGRLLVRYSGTENKARVLVEGPDQQKIDAHAAELKEVIIKSLTQ